MKGKQAKILSDKHVSDLLFFAETTRYPLRNRVIVLLSTKAGLRAGEIAKLTWDMVLDANGQVGLSIELQNRAAKKGSGRRIPIHPQLRDTLMTWREASTGDGPVVQSERGGPMRPISIVIWFAAAYRTLGLDGCSSALRPAHIHYACGSARSQSRRLTTRRAIAGRPSVDPDDATVHRRRF